MEILFFEIIYKCVTDFGYLNSLVCNKQPKSRKDILLEYVKNVQPEFMELFVKRAPQQVCNLPS